MIRACLFTLALGACTSSRPAICVVDADCAPYAEPGEALYCDPSARVCTLVGDAGVRDLAPPPPEDDALDSRD